MKDQTKTPLLDALEDIRTARLVPFDVPGHKRGMGNRELTDFLGERCLSVDVNAMKSLDNPCQPTGVIKEAESLAAEAFGASHAFFMVGGTTAAVQAMILSCVKKGDRIIMPRNVHKSAINALVLCGAVPVYIDPRTDRSLGISLGMSVEDVERVIDENMDAKAIFLNNPTYYGICSDLRRITEYAHGKGLRVLVDEAHGTHFYFSDDMPLSAMAAGVDMASVSMHKSGGSLTQSSVLLCGGNIDAHHIRCVINITQTTSSSYLLLASLDISRRNLALNGTGLFAKVRGLSQYARDEINNIGGYYAFSKELINGDSFYDFDITKLTVNTTGIGLAGLEVYDILRDEYDIQIEFGDVGNILAYISIGDRTKNVERLISSLFEIKRLHGRPGCGIPDGGYIEPVVVTTPQEAFYSRKASLPLEECAGEVCTESVICYPPGIPIIAPGEMVTREIIEHIRYVKEKGGVLTGIGDMGTIRLNVMKG